MRLASGSIAKVTLVFVAVAAAFACSPYQHADCTEEAYGGTCADPGDGGAPDGASAVDAGDVDSSEPPAPPGCDLSKAPKDSPACLSNDLGAFVSPAGKAGARGTKDDPLDSIGEAISRGLPRVYLCEGTYDERVTISRSVALFGGLRCTWEPAEVTVKVAPASGVALTIANVAGPVLVQDLELAGQADGAKPGDSAIVAFVSASKNVVFRNAVLVAGNATAGTDGTTRSNYTGAHATKGANANGSVAGAGPACACTDGTSSKGGNGAAGNGSGSSDGSAVPSSGTANGGLSGPSSCVEGTGGANGGAGGASAAAPSPGALTASGWTITATSGSAPNGRPGQGGGGGGAKTNNGFAGGGGGCGGCGGAGGEVGGSGGSSFALASFDSAVVLEGGRLASGAGASGGRGAAGQPGQAGGDVGEGVCNGGAGGSGAGGTGGSGGPGGHSAPIVHVGAAPVVTGASLTPGAPGGGGAGGPGGSSSGVAGADGSTGQTGKAQTVLGL